VSDTFDPKRIAAKERIAQERRIPTHPPGHPRLPVGQRQVFNFPVLDLGVVPNVDLDPFHLEIDGAVERPLSLTWAELLALTQTDVVADFHCVTTWSRLDNRWGGILLQDLLALARPTPKAAFLIAHSLDGYSTNLPLPVALDDDVLVAHHWEGQPLTAEHGGPLRLVVPKRWAWKSAKWVNRLTLTEVDHPGFWEVRGYHNNADPWGEDQERYSR